MSSSAVIGSRGSRLALVQSEWVAQALRDAHPGLTVSIRVFSTRGDRELSKPIPELGGKGAFTEELQAALLGGDIDLAVHSLKDLPTAPVDGITVVACPVREDPRDAWISPRGTRFGDLVEGGIVGTSSLRRAAQLQARFPRVTTVPIRGNVETRLRKAGEGELSGTLLAAAGLRRLGMAEHITEYLDPNEFLPSPGQGVLAVEGRDDELTTQLTAPLEHGASRLAARAERAFLEVLEGGCLVPAGAFAEVHDEEVRLAANVVAVDGSTEVRRHGAAPANPGDAASLGRRVARDILDHGGREILDALRGGATP